MTKTKFGSYFVVSILSLGLIAWISSYRWLWNDEASSVLMVMLPAWEDYFLTSPLYFLMLKGFVSLQPQANRLGIDSVFFVRLVAAIPMAITAAFIFHLALQVRSKFNAVLATSFLIFFVFSHSFLEYSWQARHYGLWVLLSAIYTAQILEIALKPEKKLRVGSLFITSVLLCLSSLFGLIQVMCAGLFFLMCKVPRRTIIQFAAISVLPLAYFLFCRNRAGQWFYLWPGIKVMLDLASYHARLVVLALFAVVLISMRKRREFGVFSKFVATIAVSVGLVMFSLWRQQTVDGYQVPDRYFLYLYAQFTVVLLYAARQRVKIGFSRQVILIGLAVLLTFAGVRRSVRFVDSLQPHPYAAKLLTDLQTAKVAAADGCLCIDFFYDERMPRYEVYMTHLLEVRAHNANKQDCSRLIHMTFQVDGRMSVPSVVNLAGRFDRASGLCFTN